MAKEQVQNVADEEAHETVTDFEPEYGDMIPVPDLFVEREKYSKKGKDYYSYQIKTTLDGSETHIDFRMGEDVGAYRLLDLVFGKEDKVQFAVQPFKTKNATTKQVRKGFRCYAVRFNSVTGLPLYGDLVPAQQSDRTILDQVLAEISYYKGVKFEA